MLHLARDNLTREAMSTSALERLEQVWPDVAPLLFVPHTEDEYQRLVSLLDSLLDRMGEGEAYPLASLLDLVGVLLRRYEDVHVPELI
jgi:HTH-type transcriptional regulator/antitoxin HigA